MLEGHRMEVPLLMGTHVEHTVAHIVKNFPYWPFIAVRSANLICMAT